MFIGRRLPFDWKTPHGYALAFLYESITDYIVSLTYIPLITVLIGSCWFFIAFVKDITNDLFILDKNEIAKRNDVELTQSFCKIVKFYSDANELSFFIKLLIWCKNKTGLLNEPLDSRVLNIDIDTSLSF